MKKVLFLILLSLGWLNLVRSTARADGIIIPEPPICDPGPCPPRPIPIQQLVIRYHRVSVEILDQVAVTHVDQVFYNPNDWTVEGTYFFPIPQDAAVSDFILWVDGEPVSGEILEAEEARATYEDIVRNLRDPALLEYADRGAVRARIFPIQPREERRIELEYTQVLPAEIGLVRYVYPLNTEKFSVLPLEEVSISVEVKASDPIRAVYSPSHPVAISRESDFQVRAGYEGYQVLPDTDFALYYSLGQSQAFHLLSYRDAHDLSDPDGFFLLLLAPRPNKPEVIVPKDVLLVLDRSGSMEGEKFRQAQDALRYILRHMNPEDRFNIIAFSTGVEVYAPKMHPATEVKEALPWVDSLNAGGSTDINRALLEAISFAQDERPTFLIFLTDGLPTEGVVDSRQILDNFTVAASGNLRFFAFGVGYDVDTFLLDSLAQAHHGNSTYVLPGEPLDEILSGFYARISTPVLTNLRLDFGQLATYDLYPNPLPDLFLGSQIVVVGRYRHGGVTDVVMSGEVNGEVQTFRYPEQSIANDSRGKSQVLESLPRLWATRKIGHLLNQIRLHGPDQETIDQIVRLSIRYGIVTPYTSYLVTEPMPLGAAEQDRIAQEQFQQLQAMPTPPASGQEAVEKAAQQGSIAKAEAPAVSPSDVTNVVRVVGARTYVYRDGLWTDTAFDPDVMETVKVAFLSKDYFTLSGARPNLAAAFALGERVIAISDGVAYEVVSSENTTGPIEMLPTFTPTPEKAISAATPAPKQESTEIAPQQTSSAAPGTLPCAAGLVPLFTLPMGLLAFWYWRLRY